MRKVVIVFGLPGSGKGTQSKSIGARYGIPAITTGDILREKALQDEALRKSLAKGDYTPDEVIGEFLEEKIESIGGCDFIFDGFPRTLSQLKTQDELEKKYGLLTLPVYINIGPEVAINRLSARYVCDRCGLISAEPGVCSCGGHMKRRSDDHPDVIRHRLQVFEQETAPVIEVYRERGNLIIINGEGTQDAVSLRIYEKLDNYFKK